MQTNERASASDEVMPGKTLLDCQTDAIILAALMEGIDLMENEGDIFKNARAASMRVAARLARELADDLDNLGLKTGRAGEILNEVERLEQAKRTA